MRRNFLLLAYCIILTIFLSQSATAEVVYVSDVGHIGRVDTETGRVLDVKAFPTIVNNGPILFNEGGFTDIAFSPTGQLYGITGYSLWSVDYNAGTSSRIAQMSGGKSHWHT